MKLKSRPLAAVVAALAALTLAGCTSPANTASDSAAPANKTLRLPLNSPPGNFQIGNWPGGESYLFQSVYDTILHRGLDGQVGPGIAEKFDYSQDRKTLTLGIRSGMKFTDGAPVDAAAVVASLEVARKGPSSAPALTAIADVKATDDSTVTVTLSKPDAALLPVLSSQQGAVGSPKVLTAESSKLEPVGSGPYTIDKSGTTVGGVYTLKRNPDYWDVKSYPFETVVFRVMSDPTAVQNALRAGQLDFSNVQGDQLSQFEGGKFTTGHSNPQGVGAIWLVDRGGKIIPALADIRVRQAINKALDRDLISKSLGGGTMAPTNQLFSPLGKAFDEDLQKINSYDVDGAKKLMADAGYANGFDVTMPSTPISTNFESAISQALGEIGIRVKWEPIQLQDFFQKVYTGNYGMFFMYNGLTSNDAQDSSASLSGLFNVFQNMTPELQQLVDTANAAPGDKQGEAFHAVNEYLVNDAWAAPISIATNGYVISKDVTYTKPVIYGQTVLPFAPAK